MTEEQISNPPRAETGPDLSIIDELISRMTLAEKAGQMSQLPYRRQGLEQALHRVRQGAAGSFLNARPLEVRNQLQRAAVEQSRLGIPLVFGRDVIHGYRTVFPIGLGQSTTFNPELVEQAAAVAAREASEDGIDWTFAPMVDIARDPRWGRVAESPGEDPYLASRMGAAMVRGFQGEDPSQPDKIAACAKHYVGYGAAEAGKDYNSTLIPEQLLREVYLAPFLACVSAGALTLMSGFNDLNGVPATGNELRLRRILKEDWRFSGFVVSDWAAMREMIAHGYCSDEGDVARTALRAGVDMEMASRAYLEQLPRLVEAGVVPVALVDEAVRRILTVKWHLGLFARPYTEPPKASVTLCPAHLALARQAAAQSVVLLKNEAATLPLNRQLRALAVVGPLADDPHNQLGCWAFDGSRPAAVSVLSALQQRLGATVSVKYARGMQHCRDTAQDGFSDAVAAARACELTLAVVGEEANLSGECRSRAYLDLPGAQLELLRRLAATGKPLVVVFMAGRPLLIGQACGLAQAALYAWHPGTMGGPGLVDVLVGDVAPSGRLPITFPRAVGQIPIYYGHKNTGRPPKPGSRGFPPGTPLDPVGFSSSYLDLDVTPEYPFGFGLSYTTFDYGNLRVTPQRARLGEQVVITADVHNSGEVEGEEVVQLYVHDLVGSVTRPVLELKGFRRIRLRPGQSATVEFVLDAQALAFPGPNLEMVTEPGCFEVLVGGDSQATLRAQFELAQG